MKIKNYKILALLGVGLITALTTAPTLKDANASLTAPTSYTIGFNGTAYTGVNGAIPTSVALFERTSDGSYFNYYHRFRDTRLNPNHTNPAGSGMHSNPNNYNLPVGLDITMQFNRSNTNWTIATPYNGYYNTDTKIGSNSSVGAVSRKWYVKFDNQTTKDYRLFLDFSSTADINRVYHLYLNGEVFINNLDQNRLYYVDANKLFQVWIPAYSYVEFYTENNASNTNYLDAWYLQDLGVSDAYNAGYNDGADAGYIAGQNDADLLITGFQAMVGILINLVLMVVNLEVFGVSLLGLFSIVILFASIVWGLKLIRG